jgi:hypothetical protein
LAFQAALTDWVYRNYQASWDHKAAINALPGIEEAERYDLERGWPGQDL